MISLTPRVAQVCNILRIILGLGTASNNFSERGSGLVWLNVMSNRVSCSLWEITSPKPIAPLIWPTLKVSPTFGLITLVR